MLPGAACPHSTPYHLRSHLAALGGFRSWSCTHAITRCQAHRAMLAQLVLSVPFMLRLLRPPYSQAPLVTSYSSHASFLSHMHELPTCPSPIGSPAGKLAQGCCRGNPRHCSPSCQAALTQTLRTYYSSAHRAPICRG